MKNKLFIIASFLAIAILALASQAFAAEDWSQYESGRDNIRLDGYHGQPGYIAFTDGDGNIAGYLYMSRDPTSGVIQLIILSPGAFSTGKLGTQSLEDSDYLNIVTTTTQRR